MTTGLDAPTVWRLGTPTLGVPVLGLDYHQLREEEAPHIDLLLAADAAAVSASALAAIRATLAWQHDRLHELADAVAYFDLPWYVRFWRSLRGHSRAAQRRRALRSSQSPSRSV